MARFRLLTDHWLEISGVPQLVEAGAEINTTELPGHFLPSPKMAALDGDALTALVLVCQGIRRAAGRHRDVAGFGHVDNWSRAED
jgi:hypothetical protein